MKQLYLLITSIICMMYAHAVTIEHTVNINANDVEFIDTLINENNYVLPYIKGIDNRAEYGQPSLPRIIVSFALPNDANDITVSAINTELYNSISLESPIMPYLPEVSSKRGDSTPTSTDPSNYKDNECIVEISHIENFKDINKIVSVCVCPILYDPINSIADIYSKCIFSIKYDTNNYGPQSNKTASSSRDYLDDIAFLKTIVANPDDVGSSGNPTEGPKRTIVVGERYAYEYTIITSAELAPAFQRLVALKRIQGYDAGIVLIEDILNDVYFTLEMPGVGENDDAGKLKSFLMINSPYISYVLLGGKPPIVPMRYGYCYDSEYPEYESFIPSDLYYGTTDTDWNHNGDSIMGEYYDGFNYTSQFYIGRLSCTTQEEVNNYVKKLEIYELNPGMGDPSYLNNSYTHISNEIYGRYSSVNNMKNRLSNFFETNIISGSKDGRHTGNLTISEMDGNFGFYNIHGHGNPEGISTWDDKDRGITYGINGTDDGRVWLTEETGNGLDNISSYGKPGIMLTGSCGTMPYDSPAYNGYGKYFPECNNIKYNFAESYCLGKDYGGVAYIGNTKEIYTYLAKKMAEIFIDLMKSPYLTIGELTEYTRSSIVSSESMGGGKHRDLLGFGIIGDPSVKIWNGKRTPLKENPIDSVKYDMSNNTTEVYVNKHLNPKNLYTISMTDINGETICYGLGLPPVNDNKFTIDGGGPNKIFYMTSPYALPYISDIEITSLQQKNDRFLYANNVSIGSKEYDSLSNVVISDGAELEIMASGDVDIMPDTKITGLNSPNKTSKLIIRTPGTCTIYGVEIESNAKLIVYANNIVIHNVDNDNIFNDPQIEKKTLVLKGYADFGTFAYKPPRISDYRPGKFKTKDADPYYPLLQEGKEWRYTMYNPTIKAYPDFIPGPLEVNRVIRLENPIEIDGEVYLQANAYYDGEHQHDEYNPMVYIREDESSKKVIVKLLTNRDDIYCDYYTAGMYSELYFTCTDGVLYDFNNPLECHVANRSEGAEEKFFDCLDGPHRGFDMQTYVGDLAIVEGIGCVHNDYNNSYSYDLFGFACSQLSSLPDWCYLPYLYEVANADGTVIYRDPKFAPGWTSSSSVISDNGINISVVDGNIVARCPSEITEMSVFNLQGIEVAHGHGESGEISLPNAGLLKGVYMIQCGEHIQKVILK